MRRSIATPCPVAAEQCTNDTTTYGEDTTTNIEFTTAFQASFRHVKPRRGPTTRRATTNFKIHEDKEETAQPVSAITRRPVSSLTQPAKRVIPRAKAQPEAHVSQNPVEHRKESDEPRDAKPQRLPVAPRRFPHKVPAIPEAVDEGGTVPEGPSKQRTAKDARRKTLYMPSEDTTQPTMWMGIFSPIKNEGLAGRQVDQVLSPDLTGIAAQMAEKRKRRTSTMQSKAKRLPLQSNLTTQEKAIAEDRAGAPTGKENVPPGYAGLAAQTAEPTQKTIAKKEPVVVDRDFQRRQFLTQARLDHVSKPTQSSPFDSSKVLTIYEVGKSVQQTEQNRSTKRVAWNAGPRVVKDDSRPRTSFPEAPNESKPQDAIPPKIPTRFVRPLLADHSLRHQQVPILEHIENPAMYEEDWLGQQEIVISQLLNSLFDQAHGKRKLNDGDHLRRELVDLYNSPAIALMHSRVQAALLYGSLSLSHEAIFQMQNLVNDVGRRRQFLNFWIDNYDNDLLKVALEVVTGKQVNVKSARTSAGSSPAQSELRKALSRFIEAFLLRNEDIGFKSAGTGARVNDLGSRTMLRSLMLVKALDLLQQQESTDFGTCLFRVGAAFKSSTTAVQTLMRMVNPAVGDPLRALRHLGFEVYHEQHALKEVSYHIDNIAVDLRDGVALTRLVELLLYRTSSTQLDRAHDGDTNTICMPEGETLLIGAHNMWPLSQHLKLPCMSRAAKIWNVQIALAALGNVQGIGHGIEDVSASDIVDGYREMTVKLLWTLVGRYGLVAIVDRDDLRHEIRRLSPSSAEDVDDRDTMDENDVQAQCEHLLKAWTRAVAASQGQVVRNFTTGFSDGQTFKAILDEYEPYLLPSDSPQARQLQERLLRLGCSRQFSGLFSNANSQLHIFGKDFVLAALAFLCSRVVGPSKLCRKAVMIQRCWRRHQKTVQKERQAIKRKLAEACAASVKLRQDFPGHTNIDDRDTVSRSDDRPEIDDDIWLSL